MFREVADAPAGEVTQPVKTEPGLNDFITWLEKQPAEKEFDWTSAWSCAMALWWQDTHSRSSYSGSYSYATLAIGQEATMVVRKSHTGVRSPFSDTRRWSFGRTLEALKKHRDALPQNHG